jgi:DHA1 family multidrug resistance protein-like MFS transporter
VHLELFGIYRKFHLCAWNSFYHGRFGRKRNGSDTRAFSVHPVRDHKVLAYKRLTTDAVDSGYGCGPMLWSPMSEIPRLGRSGIYFWTLFAFILLQLPTGYAVNMPMFLVFRWVTGFVGSPALATGGATIGDIYDPARAAYAICMWASFGVCGPVFGPILGGYAAPVKGWRWTIWIFTWLCTVVLIIIFFLLPETSAANILYRRAKRLRKATGDDRLRSQSEIDTAEHTARDHLLVLGRAFTLTFSEPIVFFADLYTALLYGVLFIWFESFPIVFGDIYGFDLGQQGLVFLGIFVGGVMTIPFYLLWIKYGIIPRFTKPNFKPEMVLPPTFFGSLSLPICLFWYGWSARESVHWIMPVIGSSFFTVGVVTLFNAVLNYLGISYPAYAASIFAGNALFRASFGAIFPLFVSSTRNRSSKGHITNHQSKGATTFPQTRCWSRQFTSGRPSNLLHPSSCYPLQGRLAPHEILALF